MGKPEKVYAHVNQLRPETFPKVEDNSTMILSYKNGVGLFEGSWDLPRSFQDLEVFGLNASLYMQNNRVKLRKSRAAAEQVTISSLPPERAEPPEVLVAPDINVGVNQIIEAAKVSVRTGKAVHLPTK